MSNSFENLIEIFGIPKIVIPNTPRTLVLGNGAFMVSKNPEFSLPSSQQIYHRRFQHGDSDFLAVSSRIETQLHRQNELLEYLQCQNLTPIEFVYTYEKNRSNGLIECKVAIATSADAAPLNKNYLEQAIAEKRLIRAGAWSSMGDAYLDVRLCSKNQMPTDDCLYFLFETPDIPERMLAGIGEYYDGGDNVLDFCGREYFTRTF